MRNEGAYHDGRGPGLMLAGLLAATLGSAPAGAQHAVHADTDAAPVPSAEAGAPADPAGMVYVPGGVFQMGQPGTYDDEGPVHEVALGPYWIDAHEVTNARFAAFVEATGHVTQAERDGYAWAYVKDGQDFERIGGANWRQPEGPGSSISDRMDHPVVCVSWHDAAAYAKWAGRRLPTEAEWEYAARSGGGEQVIADVKGVLAGGEHAGHGTGHGAHGSDAGHQAHAENTPPQASAEFVPHPSGRTHASGNHAAHPTTSLGERIVPANVWHGTWPLENHLTDSFFYTAPAGSFAPNALGVHDMLGNVWEWTADWYAADYYQRSPRENPTGPASGQNRVARGGSWFCSANYCGAYNSHYRGASPPDHAFNNVGFRTAADVRPGDAPASEGGSR